MSKSSMRRRSFLKGTLAAGAALALPSLTRAQPRPIRIGMPTILSGRVAQLGFSSRNAVMMEVEAFNAAGGVGGRKVEVVIKDSKGKPDEAGRVARELINSDRCDLMLDCEASSGAFAVHEVVRDLGTLCIHAISETSSLSADPKFRIPNAFRAARQGVHDSIVGGSFAARIVKEKGLRKWMLCSPDYAYGRDTSAEFMEYLRHFEPSVQVVGEAWPKLFQPDYTDVITKILQVKPQAVYSALWGGDLVSFIDQANLYGLFEQTQFFAVNMADYTTLTTVKNLPKGIYSGNRYVKAFPSTPANAAWADAYRKKFNEHPLNWSWEAATGIQFMLAALKKVGEPDGKKMAAALKGMTIDSPFGANGKITMRAEDQTVVDYAAGWGTIVSAEPYLQDIQPADWKLIAQLEKEWKKKKGFLG